MTAVTGFMHNILDNPADEASRLIFADWLEEQPDPALNVRGEFLRVQVELDSDQADPSRRAGLEVRQR